MARMKLRPIIALGDVPAVFDEDQIGKLAKIAKLPGDADLNRFGAGIKEAARIFVRDALVPTANELHNEIANLYKAANRQSYELGQRFRGSNHIRRPRQACRTKCG
jgi:hypothetical protein